MSETFITPSSAPAGRRVLVADDSDVVVQLLRRFLESDGYYVGSAPHGIAALDKFCEAEWDLVITDRHMPFIMGEELARGIKSTHPNLPIMLITGSGEAGIKPDLFDAILAKPFTRTALLDSVRALLKKGTPTG